MIQFDKDKLSQLREACAQAKRDGHETFMFEGHTLLVSYAKYLIEYLEGQLGKE